MRKGGVTRRALAAVVIVAILIVAGATARRAVGETSTAGVFFTFIGSQLQGPDQLEWPVTVDLQYLETLPATAVLNFPDRPAASVTQVSGEASGPGTFFWTANGDGCSVVLNVAPTNVIGAISCLTGNYALLGNPSSPNGYLTLQHFGATAAAVPIASTPSLTSLALLLLSIGLARVGSRRPGSQR